MQKSKNLSMRFGTRRCAAGMLVLLTLSALSNADTSPNAIAVTGDVAKAGNWTPARLKSDMAQDVASITYTTHDQKKHTSTAVPLMAVLRASGIETQLKPQPNADPKSKHRDLRLMVIVQGRDGYTAVFSLGELLSDVGNRPAWIALDADGQPLAESEGPTKLIVPEDGKPARWVHAIAKITLVDAAKGMIKPATRPGLKPVTWINSPSICDVIFSHIILCSEQLRAIFLLNCRISFSINENRKGKSGTLAASLWDITLKIWPRPDLTAGNFWRKNYHV